MCFLWIFLLRIVSSYLHNFFSIYKRIISKKLFAIPCTTCNKIQTFKHLHIIAMLDVCVVEIKGVEPLTSCLQGRRSSQLSYIPMAYINVLFKRVHWKINNKPSPEDWLIQSSKTSSFSLERRWSSRTFWYGYLVTTSPQSLILPSTAASLQLAHRLRVFPTLMVWRAVCTRPGNVFTAVCWPAITSNSGFMKANFSLQSELRLLLEFRSTSRCCFSLLQPL